jgi:predicted O-methyltransferase YrrM
MLDLALLLKDGTIPGYDGTLAHRTESIKMVYDIMRGMQPKVLVETGVQSSNLLHAQGASTLIFAEMARQFGGQLYSVDINPDHIEKAKEFTRDYKVIFNTGDSVEFLSAFPFQIDFLYLDAYDFYEGCEIQSREHQLREIVIALPKLKKGSLILLDDAYVQMWFPRTLDYIDIQGKTYLTHHYLLSHRAKCIMDIPSYQRLYILE